jgi:DNA polymerase III subunit delta'
MNYPWQQSQWQKVQLQLQAGKLPHALLLVGAEGLGKQDFALQLAHSLLCQNQSVDGSACGVCSSCHLLEAETHPDMFTVQAEEKGKAIKVDDIRQLSASFTLTSQFGGYKVVVIVDAHDMNINASNSLLKTLEEPVSDSILILVSSNPQKLPITVRSRCQLIHFTVPEPQQAIKWLEEQGVGQPGELLNLAHGAPLLAMQLKKSELLDNHRLLIQSLLSVASNQPLVELAEQLHKLPLGYMLNWLYDWVQDLLKLHQCGEQTDLVHDLYRSELVKLVDRSSIQSLYEYLDQLIKQKQLQSIPLNTQLLWEDLLLSWHKQLKRV